VGIKTVIWCGKKTKKYKDWRIGDGIPTLKQLNKGVYPKTRTSIMAYFFNRVF